LEFGRLLGQPNGVQNQQGTVDSLGAAFKAADVRDMEDLWDNLDACRTIEELHTVLEQLLGCGVERCGSLVGQY
jgi:hypothetical protein